MTGRYSTTDTKIEAARSQSRANALVWCKTVEYMISGVGTPRRAGTMLR